MISGLRRYDTWNSEKVNSGTETPNSARPSTFVRPRLRVDVFLCPSPSAVKRTTRSARTPGGRAEDDVSRHGCGLGTERRDLRRHPCAQVGVSGGVGDEHPVKSIRFVWRGQVVLNCFSSCSPDLYPSFSRTGKRGILQGAWVRA